MECSGGFGNLIFDQEGLRKGKERRCRPPYRALKRRPARAQPSEIVEPVDQTLPFVFCSPIAGGPIPAISWRRAGSGRTRSAAPRICSSTSSSTRARARRPFLLARFPRAYLDVTASPTELDPGMFAGALPDFANSASVRVAGGLGTIPRIVAEREEIYRAKLPLAEIERRVDGIYFPFHEALEGLIERTRRRLASPSWWTAIPCPSSVRLMPGGGGRTWWWATGSEPARCTPMSP